MASLCRSAASTSARDYNAAVTALNGLQSNFSIVEAIRKAGPGWNQRALPEMIVWVRRVGYEVCMSLSSAVVRLAGTCLTIAIV